MKIFFTTQLQIKSNSVPVSPSDLLVLYCITLSPQLVGVQCPINSPLGEFPGYWDWLRYPGRVGVHRLFPFAFHISVLFNSLFTCTWISSVFLLYGRRICTHSVEPSYIHFLGEFPDLGLAMAKVYVAS